MQPASELFASFEVRGAREAILAVWARLITFENEDWYYSDSDMDSGDAEATIEIHTQVIKPDGLLWLYLDSAGIGVRTIAATGSWSYTREKRAIVRDRFITDVLEPVVEALGADVTIEKTMVSKPLGLRAL